MKSKVILVFLIAILSVISAAMLASASHTVISGGLNVGIATTVNGADADAGTFTVTDETGSTIPIRVEVQANENVTDAVVKIELADEEAKTGRFDIYTGNQYTKLLSVQLPDSIKNSPSKTYHLLVTVKADNGAFMTYDYSFSVQRESYNLEILSADVPSTVTAGSTMNVDVVVKNRGIHEAEDTFVVARILALGVEKKVYLSDLTPTDECNDCDKEDSAEGIVSLKIPSDAKAGTYDVEIEAYNGDSEAKVTKRTVIAGLEQGSDVFAAIASKDISSGSTTSYDLILVNSGNRIAVYNIVPESAQNLVITVDSPIVTVPADSSAVVKVNVQAGNVMGTFNFAVDVNSHGQLVKRVNLAANVTKAGIGASSNVIVLTVVLAIIFVVLLVVLIVLLTRKPAKSEEFEESYY